MILRGFILGKQEKRIKDAYTWNAIGGILNAGQSAILLVVLSRTNSVEDAGIFSIAYAIACLALKLGLFGMRGYQVSDIGSKYSFSDYYSSRVLSAIAMLLLILFYMVRGLLFLDYSISKMLMILLLGLLKLVEVVEDVYHGQLQFKERLDVGAKCMASRYIGFLLLMILVLVISGNLIVSAVAGLIFSIGFLIWSVNVFYPLIGEPIRISLFKPEVWKLLGENLVLMSGGFLMMYAANAPKYAIDANMSDSQQACFNYIFMPVYVVGLLATFIYQPIVTKMASLIDSGDNIGFKKEMARQSIFILVISVLVMLAGTYLGIPVLSVLFNTDLFSYRKSFIILLAGGCFLGFSNFYSICITIIRKQNLLLAGYILPAAVLFVMADGIVIRGGIRGISIMYSILMLLQTALFAAFLLFVLRRQRIEHGI